VISQHSTQLPGLATPRPMLLTRPENRRQSGPRLIDSSMTLLGSDERSKAIVDFFLGGILFLLALPAILVCMLLVRLSSRGPSLYTQTRMGQDGQIFTLFKIRTMYHNCEDKTGPRWSLPGDTRITPCGRIMRKLHLDELPQLWNVLRGDMSLIGPRPERPEIVARLRQSVPGYHRRHAVKPGITGFAQINLPPDTCIRSVKNKVAYDLFYIRHRCIKLELYIFIATCLKLLGLKPLYQRKPRIPTE